jgi:hypothetical protein
MFPKNVKQLVKILVIFLFTIFFSETGFSAETAPPEVLQAATNGLGSFLNAIPNQEMHLYGFTNREEIAQATLGKPFRIYTISPDEIINYRMEKKLAKLISTTNLWIFPVYSLGKVRALLTIDLMNGKWQAVAFGSSELAKRLDMLVNNLPKNYENRFVRIYQAKSDFIVLFKGDTAKMVPLTSAEVSLQLSKKTGGSYDMYEPSEVIPRLIPLIKENLKSDFNYK